MRFPNTPEYYSINLPESVQNEIQDLPISSLEILLYSISVQILDIETDFFTIALDDAVSEAIQKSFDCKNDWLSFSQWVLEGLRHKVN